MGKRRSLKPGGKDEPSDDEDDYEETSEPLKPAQIEEIQSRKKLTAKRRINDSSSSSNSTKLNPFSSFGGFKATPTPSTTLITSSITPISQNGASSSSSTSIAIDNNKQNENDSTINETEVNFIQELNKLYEKYYGNKRDYKIPSHLIDKNESDKTNYAQLLMELNKRCSKWISKHVEESPFVYLTPIFIDYFNYLIQLEKEFFPNTLFTKTENGIHKKTNSLLLNGTKPTTTIETPPPTVTNTILKQVEEVSTTNSIKFPSFNNTTAFKFSPIPLTTTTTTAPIVAAPLTTTTTTTKLDFFGTSSPSTSFKFGQTTESVTKPLVETTTSFFNKPTTLIENKKDETESPQLKFSLVNTNNTHKTSPIITTTTPATTSSFSLTTSPFAFNPKVPPISSQPPTNPSPLSLFSSTQSTNLFSTQQPVSTNSSLFSSTQSPSSSLFSFSQTTATKTSTDTSTTPQKGGLFSSLLSANQSTTNDSSKPFSFGNLPPSTSLFGSGVSSFGFASQQTKPQSNSEAGGEGEGGGGGDDEAYEPPKPEVKEIVEEGALYSKRIKLYYFNIESNQYVDRGIGNLHIKLTSDGAKKQMIIRAETSLGNILLNVALSKQIPVNKISKNRLLMVCIANPPIPKHDEKTPCKFLIQVKTEDDTNELLDKINEMKN